MEASPYAILRTVMDPVCGTVCDPRGMCVGGGDHPPNELKTHVGGDGDEEFLILIVIKFNKNGLILLINTKH